MSDMTNDPIQTLTDTLVLLRNDIADVRKRQTTPEQLEDVKDAMDHAIERYDKIVGDIYELVAIGSRDATLTLQDPLEAATAKTEAKVDEAVQSLSQARTDAVSATARAKRTTGLLMGFSALTGLATGALLSLLVFDYYLGREYIDRIQGFNGLFWCERDDGLVLTQGGESFCAVLMGK